MAIFAVSAINIQHQENIVLLKRKEVNLKMKICVMLTLFDYLVWQLSILELSIQRFHLCFPFIEDDHSSHIGLSNICLVRAIERSYE